MRRAVCRQYLKFNVYSLQNTITMMLHLALGPSVQWQKHLMPLHNNSDDSEMIRMHKLWNIILLNHTSTVVPECML